MADIGLELNWLTILTAAAWVYVLAWFVCAALALYRLTRQKSLPPARDTHLMTDAAPLVSILVPARNEEHRILSRSIHSILAQDYGRFEIIAINDRSTDATGTILRSIAKADDRLRVIEGDEPPAGAGWLGKPYALQQALEQARGELVLTTDADIVLEKEAVRVAVDCALAGDFDAVTLMPYFEALSFWERVFIPSWVLLLLITYPLDRLNDSKSRQAIGLGGFFLIRRAILARIGEFEKVRAEAVEDIRLAEILKSSGARLRIEQAPHLVRTRMYSNFREIWECQMRVMFSGAKYSFGFALFGALAGYIFIVAPIFVAGFCALMIAAGAKGDWMRLLVPALIVWIVQVFTLVFINRRQGVPVVYALTTPLGFALFYIALLVSAINITMRRGVTWKGRRIYEQAGVCPPRARIFETTTTDE